MTLENQELRSNTTKQLPNIQNKLQVDIKKQLNKLSGDINQRD